MAAIEAENPTLKGVLPKDYNRPALDKVMLGELINLISGVAMGVERVLVEMLEPFPDPAHGIEDRV
jgi:hypothetical protein